VPISVRLRPAAIAIRCAEAALAGALAAAVSAATFALMTWAETPAQTAPPTQVARLSQIAPLGQPGQASPARAGSQARTASPRSLSHALAAPPARGRQTACSPRAALTAALATVLRDQTGSLAVGVTDLSTGVTASYQPHELFHTASIVKAGILATLLLQAQHQHTGLSPAEQGLATAMIEDSDNDAATALWDTIGGTAGLAAGDQSLGLRRTEPGPGGLWGLTATTVTDQLALLTALTWAHSPLAALARHYELGLMRSVEPGQNWGVTAAADPGSSPAVKNGWLPDGPAGLWVINSIGVIRHDGQRLLVAVLSGGQPTQAAGISQVQAAARAAAASVTQPACPAGAG
jgi:Beta-lactamase enzyme family